MASLTQGTSKFYYQGNQVVYPYDDGTPSSDCIRAYFADPESFPIVAPRMAATVMLIDKGLDACGNRGAQAFMLHRAKSMSFAADAYVFPGGSLDSTDYEDGFDWFGPTAVEWAQRMGVDTSAARALVVAAVRELFEECGVLLASGPDGHISTASDAQAEADRMALAAHQTSLACVLRRRGLTLRSDLLTALSRWITPVTEPRRYDTFFFAALLPPGAVADGATSEASESLWASPDHILQRFREDRTLLLPPTVYHLEKLAKAESTQAFVQLRPPIEPVLCKVAIIDGKAVAICPRA